MHNESVVADHYKGKYTVFTRLSAAPEQAPPPYKRRIQSKNNNKRRPRLSAARASAALIRGVSLVNKYVVINSNTDIQEQRAFIFIKNNVLKFKVSIF